MTIEELKAEKKKLADTISNEVSMFMEKTGTKPDIDISMNTYLSSMNQEIKNCVIVSIKATIE